MKKPITLPNTSNLSEITKQILEKKISRFLISDQGKINGIVTEKDLGFFLLEDDSGRTLDQIPLSELAKPLISIDESTSVIQCAKKMLGNGIGSIAISSGDDIVGIVTKTDITKYFGENYVDKKTVGEYMSPYYAWIYSDSPLYEIVSKMIYERISRLILRNHKEEPVGILSFRDLLRLSLTLGKEESVIDNSEAGISIIFPRKGFVSKEGFGGTIKAEELMNDEIITINYNDDLAKACQVMLEKNINGVGVLSAYGTLIGILSKTDVIKAAAFLPE